MRPQLFALGVLLSLPAGAAPVWLGWVEDSGASEVHLQATLRSAERALSEISGLEVKRTGKAKKGSPRRACGAELPVRSAPIPDCLAAAVPGPGSAVLLGLKPQGGRLVLDGFFLAENQVRHTRREGLSPEELTLAARELIEALLPGWARQGWGGLLLAAPPGTLLKVDGRPVSLPEGEPLPLTAQVHSVDLLFPGGGALLQRLHIPQGEPLRLEASPVAALEFSSSGHSRGGEGLKAVSYGLWGAGTLAVAGSLLAGASSRSAAAGLATCQGASRSCVSYDEALSRHQQAQAYARTGNLLLAGGAILCAAGAGLFTFEEVRGSSR